MSKVQSGAAEGGFRQAMAWLHTWGGLWACWVLFVIFLTGSLGVFDGPITRWMQPHLPQAAEASSDTGLDDGFDRPQAVRLAQAWFSENQPGAHFWGIGLPSDEDPSIRLFWQDPQENFHNERIDAQTGKPVDGSHERDSEGGHHFVHMHFEFHGGTAGIWFVGAFTMAMLVALVSGIVIHKRIFKDFFTFRPGKGQRSWLDAHNALSVLSLPFQLMIAYTGLATFYFLYMPAGIVAHYDSEEAYFAELLAQPAPQELTGVASPLVALDGLLPRAEQQLQRPASFISIEHPNDSSASVLLFGRFVEQPGQYRLLGDGGGQVFFNGVTGEQTDIQMPGELRGGAAQDVQSVMRNLHFAAFGGHLVRWLYFFSGLAGAAMLATGALLFMVKRRQRSLHEFGASTARVYRVIEVLNVGTLTGLSIACVAFFWGNRLLPVGIADRPEWEIAVFFAVWLLSFIHAGLRPAARAWVEQLLALAALCLLLPLLNWLSVGEHVLMYLQRGDGERAGVELVALGFGALSLWGAWRITRPKVAPARARQRAAVAEAQS
ncbi:MULTISPECIES: PepSY-associated TM helix domain-containing protein [unclassified Pseudomonas]|uniref:PepSY-associated TM helix domain-containing protein n=1 Tax=unclassified Pseudomonas TaxID=196821 RepID=UPI00244AF2D5|nr:MULTISPECIES: PepSY-associated TM helix domain-containing protein [unclassified Pseudomonas]MDG9923481.1 PepSY domain-containing protein [Pseudomonas sp. GD04045]MDH0035395.1 PepSY domain-containing protein [Pseudomonas sp. GD04019]